MWRAPDGAPHVQTFAVVLIASREYPQLLRKCGHANYGTSVRLVGTCGGLHQDVEAHRFAFVVSFGFRFAQKDALDETKPYEEKIADIVGAEQALVAE